MTQVKTFKAASEQELDEAVNKFLTILGKYDFVTVRDIRYQNPIYNNCIIWTALVIFDLKHGYENRLGWIIQES